MINSTSIAVDRLQIYSAPRFNSNFKEFNECRKRYRFARGSAGSGKSVNIAQDFILKLSDPKYLGANLLVCRKTEDTNRDSTFAELEGAIHRIYGEYSKYVWRTTKNPLLMENSMTGSQIIFRGMYDEKQREKIKSITFKKGKLTWIWLEEATEFTESDIDILDDRLRGLLDNPNLYYQITGSFNPVSAAHFLKAKYFDSPNEDTYTHHSTYLQNKFIDEGYHRRMQRRKERDPEGYTVYGEGEWGELGGLILTNWKALEFDTNPIRFSKMYNGQDFGFNHANCILEIGYTPGQLYICKELYVHEKETNEIIELAAGKFHRHIPMWCDSAEPDRILTWRKAGYNAKGVHKTVLKQKDKLGGENRLKSVQAQINWLKGVDIIIHPQCVNTLKEISQWKWRKDEKLNIYTDKPVDAYDDAMAALRYAIEDLRQNKVSSLDIVK